VNLFLKLRLPSKEGGSYLDKVFVYLG